MRITKFLLTVAFGTLSLSIPVHADDKVVDLGYAKYKGHEQGNGVSHWLGIRYAAPPLGELRFQEPRDPVQEKEDTIDADKSGKLCLATEDDPNNNETSEDCLFLDVYAPDDATEDSNYPVFVFIQGGGFASNSNPNLNGTGLIKAAHDQKMIVVTFNYRVGLFGFLSGPTIQKHGSLNNGLKDQRKVFEWVQRHIQKFGGDPKHVVIGGDSAGGASVALHLTAYGGRDDGYFIGSAAESQSFANIFNVEESEFMYTNLLVRTECVKESQEESFKCLQGLSSTQLQKNDKVVPFPGAQNPPLFMYGPTIDGGLVPDYNIKLFQEGKFMRIPVIFGDDTNEGTVFVPNNTNSYAESDEFIQDEFPSITAEQLAKINKLYPHDPSKVFPNTGKFWRQASDAYGEIRYICPGIFISDMYAQNGVSENWNYHFAVQDPDAEKDGSGVTHTVEVNAIFYAGDSEKLPESYKNINAPIIPVIQSYWASFITSLNPNTHRLKGTPEWTLWQGDNSNEQNRLFFRTNNTHMEQVPESQSKRCQYLSSIAVDLKQ